MRKLATASCGFSLAVAAANYLLPISSLIWLAVGFSLLALLVYSRRQKWLTGVVIFLFSVGGGFLCFSLHDTLVVQPAGAWGGVQREVHALVLAYPEEQEGYRSVELRLTEEGLPRVNLRVYDEEDYLKTAEPGMKIFLEVKLRAANIRYGKRSDTLNSKNIYLTGSVKGPMELCGKRITPSILAAKLNKRICERLEVRFPGESGAFLKAILTGSRNDLYDRPLLSLALSRAGLSHIVAVSGMHVTFLIGVIWFLMGRGKRSSCLCIPLIWAFVLMSGAPISAVRAGIMQTLLMLAPLFKRENDPFTSLSFALALILGANPKAVASISLQLSFAAMLGILLLYGRLKSIFLSLAEKRTGQRIIYELCTVAASSVAVMLFSLPLTAIHFGSFALLTPLSNILCFWAVPLAFAGGFLACILPMTSLIGSAVIFITDLLVKYILFVARTVSAVPFASLAVTDGVMLGWIVFLYLTVFLVAFSKRKPLWKLGVSSAVSIAALVLVLGSLSWYYRSGDGFFTAIDVGQGQCVSAFSGECTVVVDCGSNDRYADSGEIAAGYLRNCGRDQIDCLFLTHFHNDHTNGVEILMELCPVKKIVAPRTDGESGMSAEELTALAERCGAELIWLDSDQVFSIGGISVSAYAPANTGSTNESCMMLRLSIGENDLLLTGDAPKSAEKRLVKKYDISQTEYLLVGHHGSKSSCSDELLEAADGTTAIISCGENNYGHPTEEVLERLDTYGYQIYRTDMDGNVEIRLDGN